MTAHILSYRRIRRYLALSLKATEEHATSSHVRSTLRFENDVNMYGTQAESGGLRTVG